MPTEAVAQGYVQALILSWVYLECWPSLNLEPDLKVKGREERVTHGLANQSALTIHTLRFQGLSEGRSAT